MAGEGKIPPAHAASAWVGLLVLFVITRGIQGKKMSFSVILLLFSCCYQQARSQNPDWGLICAAFAETKRCDQVKAMEWSRSWPRAVCGRRDFPLLPLLEAATADTGCGSGEGPWAGHYPPSIRAKEGKTTFPGGKTALSVVHGQAQEPWPVSPRSCLQPAPGFFLLALVEQIQAPLGHLQLLSQVFSAR